MVPYLLELHDQSKLPLDRLVKMYDMTDFASAIADMRAGRAIKAVLVWNLDE